MSRPPTSMHPQGRPHRLLPAGFAVGGVLTLMMLTLIVPLGAGLPGLTSTGGNTAAASNCPTPGRAARSVTLGAPGFSLASGDSMSVYYELQVTYSQASPPNVVVYVPSVFGKFPLTNATNLTFYIGPKNFTLTNFSWTSLAQAIKTKTMTSPWFFSGTPALATTQLIGIMAAADRGTVELAFRWQWSVTFASNGTTVTSPWSVVTPNGTNPSEFYPAPYVQLVSKSNTTVPIGGYFNAYVQGWVNSTHFNSEFEYSSSGKVIRANHTFTTAHPKTPVQVGVQVLPTKGSESPALMLDHIHNDCGALLYSISVNAVYASSVTVNFTVSPSICGPITFNGTSFSSGGSTNWKPAPGSVPIGAPSCLLHTFQAWSYTPGLYVATTSSSSSSVIVSAGGTLTATYS